MAIGATTPSAFRVAARTVCALTIAMSCGVGAANAQIAPPPDRGCGNGGSWSQLFTGTVKGFGRMGSRDSVGLLALGGAGAIGAHRFDPAFDGGIGSGAARSAFRPGTVLGSTPFQLGAALATYSFGRASSKGCIARLGGDLFRAQLIAQSLTIGLKQATRRSRPDDTGFSFPSGHTSMTFASATVLQQHFGWKVGVPAYAVAGYVAASRVGNNRHYLSDVVFGAAVGITAGRAITVGPDRRLALSPMAVPGGGGALFTWIEKP